MCFIMNLKVYLRLASELKKNTLRVRIQSITMVKTIYCIQHTKLIEVKKNGDEGGKVLYKLINN